jgi:hypothetical protein
MVACVEPGRGWFFRINTKPWQTPVRLAASDHPFLRRDSYLECGQPLDLDDYIIEQSLRERGVIGQINSKLVGEIFKAVRETRTVSAADKEAIRRALGC